MLEEYTKYKAADLQECVGIIHDLYLRRRGGALQAVRDKYKHHKVNLTLQLRSVPSFELSMCWYLNFAPLVTVPVRCDHACITCPTGYLLGGCYHLTWTSPSLGNRELEEERCHTLLETRSWEVLKTRVELELKEETIRTDEDWSREASSWTYGIHRCNFPCLYIFSLPLKLFDKWKD